MHRTARDYLIARTDTRGPMDRLKLDRTVRPNRESRKQCFSTSTTAAFRARRFFLYKHNNASNKIFNW